MFKYIFGISFILAYIHFTSFRIMINNPFLSLFYALKDLWHYFYYRKYNICPTGEMVCMTAHFGKGKTLTAVHKIYSLYKRYNNKKFYDPDKEKFITQYVYVISNVAFTGIDHYLKLESLSQVVNQALSNKHIDDVNNFRTVLLVLIDEASVQLNSRNFKSNINADFLNTLLTSRHYHMSMFYTSQKFNLTDKLLRDVTQYVWDCNKIWRYQTIKIFDGTELENATNLNLVKPIRRTGYFIRDADFQRYDTLAVVDKLKTSFDAGDMLSDNEILELRAPHYLESMEKDKKKSKRKR